MMSDERMPESDRERDVKRDAIDERIVIMGEERIMRSAMD